MRNWVPSGIGAISPGTLQFQLGWKCARFVPAFTQLVEEGSVTCSDWDGRHYITNAGMLRYVGETFGFDYDTRFQGELA
tara:strand:+ start:2934 stop:3170 length:237 start_codon:yes stop_codon:yes gene_type:complete